MRVVRALSSAVILSLLSSWVAAKTLNLHPDYDTTLSSSDPDASLAADSMLSVQGVGDIKRSILNFDLSLLDQLDPSFIRSARLELQLSPAGIEASRHVTAHVITQPLSEMASWRCVDRECSLYWDGGTFGQASDTVKLSKHGAGAVSFDVTKDLHRSIGEFAPTGWLLREKHEQPAKKHAKSPVHDDILFSSLEGETAPRLVLEISDDAPDFMPPSVKFIAPTESFLLSANPLNVELEVVDDYPVETTQLLLLLDGEDVTDACRYSNRVLRCDLAVKESGRHTIQAGYIDNAGHTATGVHLFYLHDEDRESLGSVWHTGIDLPAANLGQDGDLYLNTVTASVLQKQSGAWQAVANLRGPQGEKGADGARGEAGEKGDKGDQGEKGDAGVRGEQGLQGVAGEKGDVGPAGMPGRDSPLADLNCAASQVAMFDGSRWVCRDWSGNPLSALNCSEGDTVLFTQGAWQCRSASVVVVPPEDDVEPVPEEPEPDNTGLDRLLTLAVPLDQLAVKASNTYSLDHPAGAFDGLAFSDSSAPGAAIGTGLGLIGNRVKRSAWMNGWACSAPATNQWLDVHFDNPVVLSRADIYNNPNYLKYSVVSMVVEISTDHGASYVEHARGSGSGLDQVIEVLFDEPTPMITNVRFRVNGNTGALNVSNCVIHIDEIVLFGKEFVVSR